MSKLLVSSVRLESRRKKNVLTVKLVYLLSVNFENKLFKTKLLSKVNNYYRHIL